MKLVTIFNQVTRRRIASNPVRKRNTMKTIEINYDYLSAEQQNKIILSGHIVKEKRDDLIIKVNGLSSIHYYHDRKNRIFEGVRFYDFYDLNDHQKQICLSQENQFFQKFERMRESTLAIYYCNHGIEKLFFCHENILDL